MAATISGSVLRAMYGGRSPATILGSRAKQWHVQFCLLANKRVLDSKDKMATDPSVRVGKLGPLLRLVGAVIEAKFCDLLRKQFCLVRGIGADGAALSAEQNLSQMNAHFDELKGMWEAFLALDQRARGTTRLRGFISEELFKLYELNLESFKSIVELCRNNGVLAHLRNTLPYSAMNETWHELLRRADKNVVIGTVARRTGQICEASMILSDPARSWIWPIGLGENATYESALDQDPEKRTAALESLRQNGSRRLYTISSRKGTASSLTTTQRAAMAAFVEKSNVRHHTIRVKFRGALEKSDFDAGKF